jgi:tetratricopeptide (TPR) repeat protein
MSLSVCLVTRNEEHNLPRVLRSVAGVADQVIVADTGSTDRTAAVAAELGATVRVFDWTDDFAAARNFAVSLATGDWILSLNPDEELLPASRPLVANCLTQTNALGFSVVVQEVMQAARPEYCTETVQLRLYRRRPDLHFVGRLHAHLDPPLEELARREGKPIYPAPITIRHHAYLSVLTEPKLRWAARLLELELRDRPGQLAMLIDYGNTLLQLKDPAGHNMMADAVEQILPLRHAPAAPVLQVQLLLEYLLTVSPQNTKSRLSRDEAWELALRWFPTSPPLFWWRAAQLFREGDIRQAADLLAQLVEFGQTGRYDRTFGFDPSIIRENALANLGACFTRLRQLDRAEQCFQQLLASPTHQAQAAQNLAVVENLRRQN